MTEPRKSTNIVIISAGLSQACVAATMILDQAGPQRLARYIGNLRKDIQLLRAQHASEPDMIKQLDDIETCLNTISTWNKDIIDAVHAFRGCSTNILADLEFLAARI